MKNDIHRRPTLPKKLLSPTKRTVFSNVNRSPRKDAYLSKPVSSPTKLDVVAADWREKGLENVPQLRKTHSLPVRSRSPSPSRKDRFIPSRHSAGSLRHMERAELPSPEDSPKKHIEYSTSRIYRLSVAQLCGVEPLKVLLYTEPEPRILLIFDLQSLTLSDDLHRVVESSVQTARGISPSSALARARKVPTIPERILDAPGLVDDYYLNLVAWSASDILAVALDRAVYLWQASVGSVSLLTLCDLQVTSVGWSNDGAYLSIARKDGKVEIWDTEEGTKLRTMRVSEGRIATHAWNQHLVSAGTEKGVILQNDVRVASHIVEEFEGHNLEICGLKWRKDGLQMASGGNDNLVNIWDARKAAPLFTKTDHTAAVKAIGWCDWKSSVLATGGGTNDKSIHLWNTSTGAKIRSFHTGSQVTSIHWGMSKSTGLELACTTGYPTNAVSIYQYQTLQKTGEITHPHEGRILYSALSPDGKTLATAAGDENLKFWKVFDGGEKTGFEGKLGMVLR